MRFHRFAPALAAGVVTLAAIAPAQAQTAPDAPVAGLATTAGRLTVLSVDAGSLLSLDLLQDSAMATTDERVGGPSALAQITAFTVESAAAGLSQTTPLVTAQTSSGTDDKSQALAPIDSPLVSAALLPVTLQAIVDEASAASNVGAGVADVDVLGGIVTLDSATVGLGEVAQAVNGDGLRGVDVDALTVLDLQALLEGLGIPLADLPLSTLLDLIDGLGLLDTLGALLADLGVDLPDLSPEGVLAAVADITGTLDNVAEAAGLDGVEALLDQADAGTLADILDAAGATDDAAAIIADTGCDLSAVLPVCGGSAQTLDDILAGDIVNAVLGLTGQLDALLSSPLDALVGQALLRLDGVDVSIVTTATDSLDTSAASVTGTLGTLTVGGLDLGQLDLLGTADDLQAVVGQAVATVDGVLGTIDPSLAGIVDISTLVRTSDVAQAADGSITSTATFTGLLVDVTPDVPALLAFIQGLAGVDSVADQLVELGLPVPAGISEITDLNAVLAGLPTTGIFNDDALFALTEGLSVSVASISQAATFSPGAAALAPSAPVTPALPTTGSNDALILLLGGALVAGAFAIRRVTRRLA